MNAIIILYVKPKEDKYEIKPIISHFKVVKAGMTLFIVAMAAGILPVLPIRPSTGPFKMTTTINMTVPANGDVNPDGIVWISPAPETLSGPNT